MEFSIKKLRRFLTEEDGATAVEYALLAGGIFLAILGAVQLLGTELAALFQTVLDGVNQVAATTSP